MYALWQDEVGNRDGFPRMELAEFLHLFFLEQVAFEIALRRILETFELMDKWRCLYRCALIQSRVHLQKGSASKANRAVTAAVVSVLAHVRHCGGALEANDLASSVEGSPFLLANESPFGVHDERVPGPGASVGRQGHGSVGSSGTNARNGRIVLFAR